LLDRWTDGRLKLFVTASGLRLRGESGALRDGDYLPLATEGDHARHAIAFARRLGDDWAVTVVPRLTTRLARGRWPLRAEVWGDTAVRLPADTPSSWRDAFTGSAVEADAAGRVPVGDLLTDLPVAVVVRA
ncbi:MAG TPA: malto-oligosyltrehalose synthase, partial [Actinomycetota bacterium]|nr:malto-oligosyltrehalose synthase [Actinomycetota bacterium]